MNTLRFVVMNVSRLDLTQYTQCGHIGRSAVALNGFIKVTQVKQAKVEPVNKRCPHCSKPDLETMPRI